MMRKIPIARLTSSARQFSTRSLPTQVPETEQWGMFPREREGNEYSVNWSLNVDGIVPIGDAFRNARVPVLSSRLAAKVESGKVELQKPEFQGEGEVLEAGAGISFEDFENVYNINKASLSAGNDLFVEDRGLGSYAPFRLGTRFVTDDAATALIFRSLLIPIPPRAVDHKARFNGWNLEERWSDTELKWDGLKYDIITEQTIPKAGERPILVSVGGDILGGKAAAVQFVQANKQIAGANVIAGKHYCISRLVDAVGYAYAGTVNEQVANAVALSSLSLVKNKSTAIVVGAPDDFTQFALSQNILYGAYHNVISTTGTSAVWNGVIAPFSSESANSSNLSVVVKGNAVRVVNPNNLAFSPDTFFFFEKGAKKTKLSPEEAVKRLVASSGEEGKAQLFQDIIKNANNLYVIGSTSDLQ